MSIKRKIKKQDEVVVISGQDKGKKGKVISVLSKTGKILVEGINVAKRHQKPSFKDAKGGIVSKEMYIDISNVALLDPKTGKASKIGWKILENSVKVRFAKKSGEILDVQG